jgi:alpha-glucosidase (family GH31 glycosyl hydrolase)
MMCPLAAIACLLGGLPAAASARTLTLASGDVRAVVGTNPWRVSFIDTRRRFALDESTRRGVSAAGGLGLRTARGWAHATRAIRVRADRRALHATLATTDPGQTLRVTLAAAGPGAISLSASEGRTDPLVTALGDGFRMTRGERMLGFGERGTAVDQRGQTVEDYVSDGPYLPNEWSLISQFVPFPGFRRRADATYYPVPWLLSTRGYGVLVDNADTSYFRLGTVARDVWSVEATSAPDGMATQTAPPELRLRVIGGGSPAAALHRFTAATGRQPPPAAPWIFGTWYQPGGPLAQRVAQIRAMRRAGVPISVAQTYLHYLPCGDQVGHRADERAATDALHRLGTAVTTYVNPMLCTSYDPLYQHVSAAGGLTRAPSGDPAVYHYSTASRFNVSQFDFTTAAGRAGFDSVLSEAVADGHDGWMEDFGEYTPLDSRDAAGATGSRAHNSYPVAYHCTANAFARGQRRAIVRFQRSGWTGAARCASVVWGGDDTTDWGFDGLRSALRRALSLGLSGVSRWGSDIGGFFALFDKRLTSELLTRWVQFGAVSAVMRTERDGIAVPSKPRPQVDDPGQIANWRRWSDFHTQLYPYLVAADADYRATGMPLMRQLALVDPSDPRANGLDDEFLFGPDMLAAPVLSPGARTRSVYLPTGDWVDVWRSARFDGHSGGLVLRSPRLERGDRRVTIPAPLDELPLLARAGAVIPMLSPRVQTLAPFGTGLVHLSNRRSGLVLLAFPRGSSAARFDTDGALRSLEGPGTWSLTLAASSARDVSLQASLRTLRVPFVPCVVTLNGRRLSSRAWSYSRTTGVLRVSFRVRRGVLVATRRC